MSTVNEIETEIQKLSIAEQRLIARHLGERLVEKPAFGCDPATDEGIRFLPRVEPRAAVCAQPRRRALAAA